MECVTLVPAGNFQTRQHYRTTGRQGTNCSSSSRRCAELQENELWRNGSVEHRRATKRLEEEVSRLPVWLCVIGEVFMI